jgi:hypothetical protein
MAGKPIVDQHRFAGVAKQDVGRLDVEMHHLLPMQVGKRCGHLCCHLDYLRLRPGQAVEFGIERFARQLLEDDIGHTGKVAIGDEARHMRAADPGQDHLLHLEADDHRRIGAAAHFRHFHQQWAGVVGMADVIELRHAAGMGKRADGKSVDDIAFLQTSLRHAIPIPIPIPIPCP